jgi:hypothetical protein
VVVAVVAEHQVDVNGVARADDAGIRLNPGVVGKGEPAGREQGGDGCNKEASHRSISGSGGMG